MKKKIYVLTITAVLVFALAGCAGNNNDSATTSTTSESIAVEATVSTETTATAGTTTASTTSAGTTTAAATNAAGQITQEEARQIALNHAGIAEADATFVLVSKDYENGVQVYEVEFYSGTTEYDYTIDAASGEIISYDFDAEGYGNQDANSGSQTDDIGEAQARSIALAKVPGATDSHIRIYRDVDDGITVYEGSIIYNEKEYEFEIRASDGTILEWSAESIYD